MAVRYAFPQRWIHYEGAALFLELAEAKAAILALTSIPYQRSWAEKFQEIELKREVAGTARIEGAEFTERELDAALKSDTPEATLTRSQRQARAAKYAYAWISGVPDDRPIGNAMIRQIHRRLVTGCDDDHCPPGELRGDGHNVTFGRPPHRGAEGGKECSAAFEDLCGAVGGEFRAHDPLIQALAFHYHLGSMHPFHDGNGRTARAVEALMLRRARLKDDLFIAMSNYYYDEKQSYLEKLSEARSGDHDLTPFLKFGLTGIARQCQRLLAEISEQVAKSIFRDVMNQMYKRLMSTRRRALAERQIGIVELLLDGETTEFAALYKMLSHLYSDLQAPRKAYIRDLSWLMGLNAITYKQDAGEIWFSVRLEWATEITESSFYEAIQSLPEARTHGILTSGRFR